MGFTYSDNPETTLKDEVRFLCGDTKNYEELSLSDEEIAFLLTKHSDDTKMAAIESCYRLAAKNASEVDTTNIGISIKASQRAKQFRDTAKMLQEEEEDNARFAAGNSFYVGGIVRADVEALDEDENYIQPSFKVGQDDYRSNRDDDENCDC